MDHDQLRRLLSGTGAWNKWCLENPEIEIDLSHADLSGKFLPGCFLSDANLTEANLSRAAFRGADLGSANMQRANLSSGDFVGARLPDANLSGANLEQAHIGLTDLTNANLSGANLNGAHVDDANLSGADLSGAACVFAFLYGVNFAGARLRNADLRGAKLMRANLIDADLSGADLTGADLRNAILVGTRLDRARLTGARIHGVSVWDTSSVETTQSDLIVTRPGEAQVTVDNLEVAQFVYLMLNNQKIRAILDTVGNKGVLILGRFEDRMHVLEAIRDKLRRLDYVPIVFNFDRPTSKDLAETVLTLAGMSRFIIADLTDPHSVPLESQAVIPNYMVPFVPIIQKGHKPFSMFESLWQKHRDWVLEPHEYETVEDLAANLESSVIGPANAILPKLRRRKAETLGASSP